MAEQSSTGSTSSLVGISDIMSAIFPEEEVKTSVKEETTNEPVKVEEPEASDVKDLEEDPKNEPDTEPVIEEEIQEEAEPVIETDKTQPEWFQKRIDKLTARAKGAEEQLAALRSEFESLKSAPEKTEKSIVATPTEADPLADVDTAEKLQARHKEARDAKRWAIMNPDGGTVKLSDGTEQFIDAEQVKTLRIRAEELIDEHIPKRANYLQQSQGFVSEAKKTYPKIFQSNTPEGQIRQTILNNLPEIRRFPDFEMLIGHAARGILLHNQEKSKPVVSKTPVKKAPVVNPGSSAPKGTKSSTSLKSGKTSQADILNYITELL